MAALVVATGVSAKADGIVARAQGLQRAAVVYNPTTIDFRRAHAFKLFASVITGGGLSALAQVGVRELFKTNITGAAKVVGEGFKDVGTVSQFVKCVTDPELLQATLTGALAGGAIGMSLILFAGLRAIRDEGAAAIEADAKDLRSMTGKLSDTLSPSTCERPPANSNERKPEITALKA